MNCVLTQRKQHGTKGILAAGDMQKLPGISNDAEPPDNLASTPIDPCGQGTNITDVNTNTKGSSRVSEAGSVHESESVKSSKPKQVRCDDLKY